MRKGLHFIVLSCVALLSCQEQAPSDETSSVALVGAGDLDQRPVGLGVWLDTVAGAGALYVSPEVYRICDLQQLSTTEWRWSTEELARRRHTYEGSLSEGQLSLQHRYGVAIGAIKWEPAAQSTTDSLIGEVFSGIYNSPRTGDLMGMELVVVGDTGREYSALVQLPEGSLGTPVMFSVRSVDGDTLILEDRFGRTYDLERIDSGLAVGSSPSWLTGDTLRPRGNLWHLLNQGVAECASSDV